MNQQIMRLALGICAVLAISSGRAQERRTEVSIKGSHFLVNGAPTYEGVIWKNPAGKEIPIEGLLMNARLVQGVFDDLNPETRDKWAYKDTGKWDPERVHELIERVKATEVDGRRLLVSTSYGGGTVPGKKVVAVSDFVLLHGNGVSQPARMVKLIETTRKLIGDKTKPIVNNEDDRPWKDAHQGFGETGNNMIVCVENGVSWGYFDYRQKGESFEQGFQNPPVDWRINSERKKQFFELLRKITDH
jgi:hypothetical protein